MDTVEMGSFEASELGWGPGHWPISFERNGTVWYRKTVMYSHDGEELAGYIYRDYRGKELAVFND